MSDILISPLSLIFFTLFFGGGFFKSHLFGLFWLAFFRAIYFLTGFFQSQAFLFIHLRWPKLGCHTISKRLKLCIQYRARHYFIEGRCSTLKGSSIYIHLSKFHHVFLSCMFIQAQQTQERHGSTRTFKKQLKLYKNTFCQLFHCKIQTFHCPNFKPLFPGILKINFVLF